MRKLDLSFLAAKLPLDFLALMGAALTAYALRTSKAFLDIRPILQAVPFGTYLFDAAVFAVVWMALFALAGLYNVRPRKALSEFSRIILACTAGIMVIIATVFFRREIATSRFIIIAVWGIAILYVWLGRLLLRLLRWDILRSGAGHQLVAIIGQNKTADALRRLYRQRPALGFTVVAAPKTWNAEVKDELENKIKQDRLYGILLADPTLTKAQSLDVVAFAEQNHLAFRYLADLFAARFSNIEVAAVGGVPIIEVKRTPLDGWGRIAKRLFDIIVSFILIVILSPVMLLVALAIKLDSRGPIFFSRMDEGEPFYRVGEGGKPFRYFKFRSMRPGTHNLRYTELAKQNLRKGEPLVKIKNDPRVTRVGRFIRKWSLDELPELFLVFLGRMSLVGPRPHLPEEVAKYEPHQRRALAIKPGITGMAQISGRSDLDFDDEVKLDTWYIENWSLWLDMIVLLKTPWAVISHRGVEEGV